MAVVGGGGQAELAVVHERALMPVPDALGWPEAGGFPEVFTTAHDAIFSQAGLGAGEHLLVHGGARGVGGDDQPDMDQRQWIRHRLRMGELHRSARRRNGLQGRRDCHWNQVLTVVQNSGSTTTAPVAPGGLRIVAIGGN